MNEVFGRYTLLRRLAVGGMAEIFLAELHSDAGFAKRVVLKRILPHLNEDEDFVRMFIDEAMVAARLDHPNIIQTHDFGCERGSYFIAMEYVDGIDLHALLHGCRAHNTKLGCASVAALGERVAKGLAYTHGLIDEHGRHAGVVHRDVSPHNIMVTRQGDVKVMDFGIAKAAARASRTTTGTIKGKLAYMAPEQAAGAQATPQADQFSLGIVLWECLSGQQLFVADTEVSLIKRVQSCHIPRLALMRHDVATQLEKIVRKALQKTPSQRFESMAAMQDALMQFRFGLGAQGIVKLASLVEMYRPPEQAAHTWSFVDQQIFGTRPKLPRAGCPAHAPDHEVPLPAGSMAAVAHSIGARHRRVRLGSRAPRHAERRLHLGAFGAATRSLLVWQLAVVLVLLVLAGAMGCAFGYLRAQRRIDLSQKSPVDRVQPSARS